MADTVVKELIFNSLTQEQFDSAKDAGTLDPTQIYMTPDQSVRLPVLTPMWFDHIADDMSWLRADTFSWHSGDVYVAAYEHLVEDYESIESETLYAWFSEYLGVVYTTIVSSDMSGVYLYDATGQQIGTASSGEEVGLAYNGGPFIRDSSKDVNPLERTDTIGDITITYYLADDSHKICLPDQETNLVALYEATGAADYYLLDTTNKQFKLPRKQKRTLIQAVKNTDGTWYNLYSDGWVEQGGYSNSQTVTFVITMADTDYSVQLTGTCVSTNNNVYVHGWRDKTVSGFITQSNVLNNKSETAASNTSVKYWEVRGYAAESAYASAGMQLEYYYVGNFEQSAIEQTAGITSETLNGKADLNLANITDSGRANIANIGMPSDTYINLTLGASGTTYTAPADGWFALGKLASSGQMVNMENQLDGFSSQTMGSKVYSSTSSSDIKIYLPVKKGDVVYISYTASGTTSFFNFIYAEGAKHLATE